MLNMGCACLVFYSKYYCTLLPTGTHKSPTPRSLTSFLFHLDRRFDLVWLSIISSSRIPPQLKDLFACVIPHFFWLPAFGPCWSVACQRSLLSSEILPVSFLLLIVHPTILLNPIVSIEQPCGMNACWGFVAFICWLRSSGIFGYINYLVEKDRGYILQTLVNGESSTFFFQPSPTHLELL